MCSCGAGKNAVRVGGVLMRNRLSVRGLSARYLRSGGEAVRAFDLEATGGTITALVGPSGSGKSTILQGIAGLLESNVADVKYQDFDFDGLSRDVFQTLEPVGFAFQRPTFFEWWTIGQNLRAFQSARRQQVSLDQDQEALLASLLLPNAQQLRPSQLSGGMLARAAIARALLVCPRLLLLDEALSGMDEVLRAQVLRFVRDHIVEHTVCTLMVTHALEDAAFFADQIIVLSPGPATILRSFGPPASGFGEENTQELLARTDSLRCFVREAWV
jgi:NitT/TauT family transport system ATP-binding protein